MKLSLAHDHTLPTGVLGLALTPDGSRAFVSCVDGSIQSVETASGSARPFDTSHGSYASGCVLLPEGRTVISGGYDGTLLWHDVGSRRCWRRVAAHTFWSWQLALSPNGRRVASVSGQYLPGGWKYEPAPETEPSIRVFDALTGDPVVALSHTPPVLSCTFSPDSRHLAAANLLGEVRVWDLVKASPEPVARWSTPEFTSWGSIKSHHYSGGIYALAFAPDGESLLACGMGPMTDPMAGNGKMTWQRWDWRKGERLDRIREDQQGSGLMETVAWHPAGTHFCMAGRQAQGTWNAALFSAADGQLVHSVDTKKRITQARFTAEGRHLVIAGAKGQPQPKAGVWPPWGRLQVYRVET